MKKINDYILEKFKINSETIQNNGLDIDFNTCNIPEFDEDIDEFLEKNKRYLRFFKKRKSKADKNAVWYQFYCYLYYDGPAKKADVIKAIKGETNSQYAETFTEMRYHNICSSEKGIWKAEDPRKWK